MSGTKAKFQSDVYDVGITFPSPRERTSLGFLPFCQIFPPRLSICSAGHTHRSGAVCHWTQMPSCGRYSFSSIRLFLGRTFRQSKENSPGAAFGPALWLILCWLVSGSCSDLVAWTLLSLQTLSLSLSFKEYSWFWFDLVKHPWTSRETVIFLVVSILIQREVGGY